MSWEPILAGQLKAAFDDRDAERFKQLMRAHPSHLRDEDGADYWMWAAAMDGNLPILQAMIELGGDVNESHDRGTRGTFFTSPRGPSSRPQRSATPGWCAGS